MKITRVELDNIKKSNEFSNDIEVYEWILSTYTESVFFDNIEIMELINEAKEKLDLEKQKIIDKFCIRMSNDNCGFQNIHYKCINKLHPDYDPWKTPLCEFEKCPLKGKYLSLSNEDKVKKSAVLPMKGSHTELVTDKETDKELNKLIEKLKKSR